MIIAAIIAFTTLVLFIMTWQHLITQREFHKLATEMYELGRSVQYLSIQLDRKRKGGE